MYSQYRFPAELIFHILRYTNPRDIVRWRTVSKWFRAITYDPEIWKVLYANASFVRPPGPFPSQSTASLEYTLVQSTRLARSWATQPLRAVSHVEIPFHGKPTQYMNNIDLIGGRWLIVCQSKRRIVLYDTDANADKCVPQILWEQNERIGFWDKYSVISEEGQWGICVLLSEEYSRRWKLIEFRLATESGTLCDTIALDVPELVSQDPGPEYLSIRDMRKPDYALAGWKGGRSPFVFMRPLQLVFDTRTRLFYEFPKFHIAMDEIRYKINPRTPFGMNVILTNTHVFSFVGYRIGGTMKWDMDMSLIQAFTVPDDQPLAENRNGILRLTHEGISFQRVPCALIRNSIVDPITGSIGVRFLCHWMDYDALRPKCVDVTLHKPSPVDVTPMTVCWHAVITRENRPIHRSLLSNFHHVLFFDSSGDGYTRGLFTTFDHYPEDADPDTFGLNQSAVVKFTIDATQECCVATLGQNFPLPAEWKQFNCIRPEDHGWIRFDAIRGRLFYIRFEGKKKKVLVVIDVE